METFSTIALYGLERERERENERERKREREGGGGEGGESLQNSRTEPANLANHTVQIRMCSTSFYSMQIILIISFN